MTVFFETNTTGFCDPTCGDAHTLSDQNTLILAAACLIAVPALRCLIPAICKCAEDTIKDLCSPSRGIKDSEIYERMFQPSPP